MAEHHFILFLLTQIGCSVQVCELLGNHLQSWFWVSQKISASRHIHQYEIQKQGKLITLLPNIYIRIYIYIYIYIYTHTHIKFSHLSSKAGQNFLLTFFFFLPCWGSNPGPLLLSHTPALQFSNLKNLHKRVSMFWTPFLKKFWLVPQNPTDCCQEELYRPTISFCPLLLWAYSSDSPPFH
jgi:hypothetical protein